MTTNDIKSHMREPYGIDISDSTISRITDKIFPIVKEWQKRPLDEIYTVVFLNAKNSIIIQRKGKSRKNGFALW